MLPMAQGPLARQETLLEHQYLTISRATVRRTLLLMLFQSPHSFSHPPPPALRRPCSSMVGRVVIVTVPLSSIIGTLGMDPLKRTLLRRRRICIRAALVHPAPRL